jgi:hypothetical protein
VEFRRTISHAMNHSDHAIAATSKQAAKKVPWFVILSEAKNPSWIKTKD